LINLRKFLSGKAIVAVFQIDLTHRILLSHALGSTIKDTFQSACGDIAYRLSLGSGKFSQTLYQADGQFDSKDNLWFRNY
jgi:hypothetical protein